MNEHNNSDHDLLIRLDQKMGDFTKNMDSRMKEMGEKMAVLLNIIEKKVDQKEYDKLEKRVEDHETRISDLENKNENREVQKETVIRVGKITWKGWLGISGIILFILTVLEAFK